MNKRNAKAARKDADLSDCLIPLSAMVTESKVLSQTNQFAAAKKGTAQVDRHKQSASMYNVYEDASGNQYTAYLNKSDLGKNNNKFYVLQVLQNGGNFFLYTRYGRVGEIGVQTSKAMPLDKAIKEYNRTFKQKTGAGKGYMAIEMKMGDDEEEDPDSQNTLSSSQTTPKYAEPSVDKSVQDLINFIYDKELMEKQVASVNYDVRKLPLGKLADETVKEGYKYLKEIETALKPTGGKVTTPAQRVIVQELSGKFYTFIPHDFGRSNMSNHIIDDMDKLKQKIDLIQSLVDINIAFKAAGDKKAKSGPAASKRQKKDDKEEELAENPIDSKYNNLKCKIKTLKRTDADFKMIETYVENTKCHNKIDILDCFELEREGEDKRFNPLDLKNQKLLWHGSRFSNFVGILSQGMRIAPPEAPKSGYLFGKGVYFADVIAKSAPYCRAYISGNTALLLLCQVALGNPVQKRTTDSNVDDFVKASGNKYHSCHAVGTQQPKPSDNVRVNKKGAKYEIPNGKVVNNPDGGMGYNEFIVYDTAQIKMKYLVKVQLK